jgi:hypothetical protein
MNRVLRIVLMAALTVIATFGVSAAASADPNTATLAVTPNPAVVGDALHFTGTGYDPNTGVDIRCVTPSGGTVFFGDLADADGNIDTVLTGATNETGTWDCNSYRDVQTGQTVHLRQMAEVILVVNS